MILSKRLLFCIHFLYSQPHLISKRASSCISIKRQNAITKTSEKKASLTIEAALALPIFFFSVICMVYMLEIMVIRTNIYGGMQNAAKILAEEAYFDRSVESGKVEQLIVQAIGAERINKSVIVGGSEGLDCQNSKMSWLTGILQINVRYKVRMPLPVVSRIEVPMQEEMKVKCWTGYANIGHGIEDEEIVYITENGMVYHKSLQCNYLELSIHSVKASELQELRNESQGKYYACESCVQHGNQGILYVTDYGNRYHQSLSCSGLKRTIYSVPLQEVVGKGACSKCGK